MAGTFAAAYAFRPGGPPGRTFWKIKGVRPCAASAIPGGCSALRASPPPGPPRTLAAKPLGSLSPRPPAYRRVPSPRGNATPGPEHRGVGVNGFAAAINCMDGRTQEPVIRWMRRRFRVAWVDAITEAGAVCLLARRDRRALGAIRSRVALSVSAHGSRAVAVVGHHDCAGNPVPREEHLRHIRAAVEEVRSWRLGVTVVGLWVDAARRVRQVVLAPLGTLSRRVPVAGRAAPARRSSSSPRS